MSQEITPELKDTTCDDCLCVDQKFLHHVWFEDKDQRFCTSCVLFSHKLNFCATCFVPYNSSGITPIISRCNECHSYSHVGCLSANGMCSSCINPHGLIFMPKDIKKKREDGFCKGIDLKAARLLFAAAKIVHHSISAAHDELAYDADVAEAIVAKEKATEYVKHCSKIDTGGPSLLDFLTNGQ
ncbi:hypothetical protein Tco_1214072 [Tanacetum coccineum]